MPCMHRHNQSCLRKKDLSQNGDGNAWLFLFVVSLSLSLSLSLSALKIPLNPSKALKGPILPKMPLEAEWTEGLLNESGTD